MKSSGKIMEIPKVKNHGRIKEKYNPRPNAAQKRYWADQRAKGCLVCKREPSIHHVTTENGLERIPKNHWRVTPLCPEHHQGPTGFHSLGHEDFVCLHHIDLYKASMQAVTEYCENTGLDFPDSLEQNGDKQVE